MTGENDGRVYRACAECGFRTTFAFYNPDSVYCEGCDAKIGETDRLVESDMAVLVGDEIVHGDSGRTLATVEYDDEKIETHTSVAVGTDDRGEDVELYAVDADLLEDE